ncbi:nagb/rpia/CoA transferase-like protein [Thelephora ganbajun]|uniref:Nagb/rpia/CoA transferase-like protein n=1 Tax=Thelephora ganbajun TaxID=370292 RepID=A0ACB6ZTT5_THEGA|nr:nagb/rpia/CoA transferase-like protein [Thelephora ganbajun]
MALTELIEKSSAGTMFELSGVLDKGTQQLTDRIPNSISLNAGCELFNLFVTVATHDLGSLSDFKDKLVRQGNRYIAEAALYSEKIAGFTNGFVKDGSVILTHSYSRVVMKALLHAHKRKRISVYVTEAKPRGLGLKTYETLTAAGIPCTVVLDSTVAYVMDKVDFVLVGSEAVVESGGLINATGSNQIAIIAKHANKPFYALAESFKFRRLFPLSQYDLPTHGPGVLPFPRHIPEAPPAPLINGQPLVDEFKDAMFPVSISTGSWTQKSMSAEQVALNPEVDYTKPDLISLVISDVGILTPEGVSHYLVGMFAG